MMERRVDIVDIMGQAYPEFPVFRERNFKAIFHKCPGDIRRKDLTDITMFKVAITVHV
jgi:hypothetical protein